MELRPLTATCQLQISGSDFIIATVFFLLKHVRGNKKNIKEIKKSASHPQVFHKYICKRLTPPFFASICKQKNHLWSNIAFRTELNKRLFPLFFFDRSCSLSDGGPHPSPKFLPIGTVQMKGMKWRFLEGKQVGEGMVWCLIWWWKFFFLDIGSWLSLAFKSSLHQKAYWEGIFTRLPWTCDEIQGPICKAKGVECKSEIKTFNSISFFFA